MNKFEQEMISWIDFEDLPTGTPKEALQSLHDEFDRVANFQYNIQRFPNRADRLADYLQGLPIAIPYTYCEIEKVVRRGKRKDIDLDEKGTEYMVNNWFKIMAQNYLGLFDTFKIK